eukprot:TRINITY_DN3724_c0_g1_i1.p1 TRINITY_DN3724_c0_g1~~TRINITY_DN3724_c0_g1_i1.p1  ORF type:complete len:1081 (+),score=384.58 TRINITY_DN3724_c0_g1_i1:182-3424(+)
MSKRNELRGSPSNGAHPNKKLKPISLKESASSMEDIAEFVRARKPVDLSNCDREPIHIIGQIQGHGFVYIVDSNGIVKHTTQNVKDFTDWPVREVVGNPITQFLKGFNLDYDKLESYKDQIQFKETECEIIKKGGETCYVHCACHVNSNGFLVIECEILPDDGFEYGLHISRMFNMFSENDDLYSVLDAVANEIKVIAPYNRVMVYEFDADYNGKVIVEKSDDDTRFLNLHFPASDIPAQARELFRKNRFRIIQDVLNPASEIVPKTVDVDLSMATLRASSQMHIQYLKNMGVRCSMTISILVGVEKRFWGLITCHHNGEPKDISYSRRRYCDLLGCLLSSQVEAILQRREVTKRLEMEREISSAKEQLILLDMNISPWDTLYKLFPGWTQILNCDGVMLATGDRTYAYGVTGKSVDQIVKWVDSNVKESNSFVCDSVNDIGLESIDGLCCGFMHIRLKDANYAGLYFFRNEYVRTINWGGEPKTPDQFGNLNPRTSFQQYKQTMRGRCLPWSTMSTEYAIHIQSIMTRYLFRWKAEKHKNNAEQEKLAVERLMRENEITRQAAVTHNNFLATVTHELRTPIHSILGNTERLADAQEMNSESVHACSLIQSSSEHLLAIISDILDISKLESSRLEINPVPFNFYKKMESIVQSLHSVAFSKGIYLNLLVPVDVPLIVGDATRVGQIILNYISNAIKFTNHGGVTLRVSVAERNKMNMRLLFEVIDTGMGINPEDKAKLFQRFSQLEAGKARKYEGTGLGLSINKQLADLMGGEVNVESELGRGSTFSLKLHFPIVPGQAPLTLSKIPMEDKKSRVLVLDSRDFSREFFRYHVRQWGLEFVPVKNSTELVSQCDSRTLAAFVAFEDGEADETLKALPILNNKVSSLITVLLENSNSKGKKKQLSDSVGLMHMPFTMPKLHDYLARTSIPSPVLKAKNDLTPIMSMKKLHVLVAEDNKINQMIASTFLNSMGHSCDIAENGEEAVKKFQETEYDIILMDVMMPVMDGINATVQIRAIEKRLQKKPVLIVALTAGGESSLKKECLDVGMNDCLYKPFRKIDLFAMLSKTVEKDESKSSDTINK